MDTRRKNLQRLSRKKDEDFHPFDALSAGKAVEHAGGGMGLGSHGVGKAGSYIANRGKPSEEELDARRKEVA